MRYGSEIGERQGSKGVKVTSRSAKLFSSNLLSSKLFSSKLLSFIFYLLSFSHLLSFVTLTNAVGRTLSGEFVRCDAQTVTVRIGKTERTVPFAALKKGERERILKAHGTLPPTPKEKRVKQRLDTELAVIDAKERGGWLTKEAADRRRAAERRNAEFQLAPKTSGNGER